MTTYCRRSGVKRRHSWPPVRLRKHRTVQNIDDNPFPFFMSGTQEPKDFLFGHSKSTNPKKSTNDRLVSTRPRRPTHELQRRTSAQGAVSKLKIWIQRMERYCRREPSTPSPEELWIPDLLIDRIEPRSPLLTDTEVAFEGEKLETPENSNIQNPPKSIRSHSARPRSWLEPRADLWTVLEETETQGLGIKFHTQARPSV